MTTTENSPAIGKLDTDYITSFADAIVNRFVVRMEASL